MGVLKRYSCENQQYTWANCAYIGDDLFDLQCMKPIKMLGGIVGCPADAANAVRELSDFVSSRKGGMEV